MEINIIGTTATELCQIDSSESGAAGKNPIARIKKQKVLVLKEDGNKIPFLTPYFTGNSFRGKLRRICLSHLLDKILEKNLKMVSVENFNLMNAGGGNDFQSQAFEVVDKIRELNPLISVFGTSLAVSGKLITPNLMPYRNVENGVLEYYCSETDDGRLYSTILTTESFMKGDEAFDKRGNASYLTDEQVIEWRDKVDNNNKKRAKDRSSNDKTTKKQGLKALNDREYIIRGTDLYVGLGCSKPMTSIERGMVFKAIEELSVKGLGANTAKGFGLINYTINFDENSELVTFVNQNQKAEIIKKSYSDEVIEDINNYEKWLNDLEQDNYLIAELMS